MNQRHFSCDAREWPASSGLTAAQAKTRHFSLVVLLRRAYYNPIITIIGRRLSNLEHLPSMDHVNVFDFQPLRLDPSEMLIYLDSNI